MKIRKWFWIMIYMYLNDMSRMAVKHRKPLEVTLDLKHLIKLIWRLNAYVRMNMSFY